MFIVEFQSLPLHKPLTPEELVQEPLFSPTIILTTETLNTVPVSGIEGLVSGMEGLGSNPWESFRQQEKYLKKY
jgi:hypothetical protein